MTRLNSLDGPLLLGFDHLERTLASISKSALAGYPPYNIEQSGDDRLRITVAVAGFGTTDLSVVIEDRQLIIRGRRTETEEGRVFLHRGIATRPFQRVFALAEGIEVSSAALENGLLRIDLLRQRAEPEVQAIKVEKRHSVR